MIIITDYIDFKYYLVQNVENINVDLPIPASFFVIFSHLQPFAAYHNM